MKYPICSRLLLAAMITTLTLPLTASVTITEVTPAENTNPKVEWVEHVDWQTTKTLFEIGQPDAPTEGKAVVSPEGIHLWVRVSDASHYNPFEGADLWQGDCLQIGIDGKGDGSGGNPSTFQSTVGVDDYAIGVGLTDKGPLCWVYVPHRNAPASWGATDKFPFSVQRDDAKGETLYEITIPWSTVDASPGLHRQFGVAIQVNSSAADREQIRYYYGRGADGVPRPGLFQQLQYQAALSTPMASDMLQPVAWSQRSPARIAVALSTQEAAELSITLGDSTTRLPIEPTGGHTRLYEINAIPTEVEQDAEIRLTSQAGVELYQKTYTLNSADKSIEAFDQVIEQRLSTATHPVFIRHLKSVQSLVATEWARVLLFLNSRPSEAQASLKYIQRITNGIMNDAGEPDSYLKGERDLIFAYVSPHDRSTQFYKFSLPKDWDPEKEYPLFFELHGAGSTNPLDGIASAVGADSQAPSLHGYTNNRTFAPMQGNGYWCHPFGRGNLGYRGIAEIDIFEAYDDVHNEFKIDTDRRYLYGFSMGGGGSWSIGLRTPDRWAAIAILAGGVWREKPDLLLARNATDVPIWIWCGEADGLFPQTGLMLAELEAAGITPTYHSTPEVGHSYLMEKQEECINWLQQHVRKRPNHFFFTTDQDSTNTVWGITVERNEAISGLPSIECWIEEDTIKVTDTGAAALRLDPSENGLNLKNPVTIIWNDKEVYSGEPKFLLLENGAATEFDPTARRWRSR